MEDLNSSGNKRGSLEINFNNVEMHSLSSTMTQSPSSGSNTGNSSFSKWSIEDLKNYHDLFDWRVNYLLLMTIPWVRSNHLIAMLMAGAILIFRANQTTTLFNVKRHYCQTLISLGRFIRRRCHFIDKFRAPRRSERFAFFTAISSRNTVEWWQ